MKKALLITLALVALFAFVSCSEVTPVGTYKASEKVNDNFKVTATLSLKNDSTATLASVKAVAIGDSAIAKTAADAANLVLDKLNGDIGKWEHDGKSVKINGVDAEYNGTSLKYKVGDYTLTFKR